MKTKLLRIALSGMIGLALILFTSDLSAQFDFHDVTNQPVLSYGDPGDWDDGVVWHPSVIKDGDTLRMWYTGHDESIWTISNISKIGYAWSLDGVSWNKNSDPVLFANLNWEDQSVYLSAVIQDADTFKMWYGAAGWTSSSNNVCSPALKIGYAWSLHGINWTKHPEPVIELGQIGDWDDNFIIPHTVIKEETEYKMWYTAGRYGFPGEEYSYPQVGLATSPDGKKWTKYDDPATMNPPYAYSDPVLKLGQAFLNAWDSHRAFEPAVMKIDTEYLMFYTGLIAPINYFTLQQTGFAISTNGINWQKSVHNPIIKDDNSFVEWGNAFDNGTVLFYEGIYHYWFSCFLTPPNDARPQIGYAETLASPPGNITYNTQELIDNFHIYYPSCIEINGNVYISGNDIKNLDGLSSLTSIAGDLEISANPSLTSISGLENLTSIDGIIKIDSNSSLTTLTGLNNIDPNSISSLSIIMNPLLSICDVESICAYLISGGGTIEIHDNASGCDSQGEVELDCSYSIEDLIAFIDIVLSPNPCKSITRLQFTIHDSYLPAGRSQFTTIDLYTISGLKIRSLIKEMQLPGEYEIEIDMSGLPAGIYYIRIQAGDIFGSGKIVKMN